MERIYTTEIKAHIGERVRLAGWLHTLRRLGGINFLVLADVRGTAQVVVDTPEALAGLDGLLPETVLAVEGDVVAEPQAPGGFELHAPAFEILSPVRDALPFSLNKPELKAGLPVFLDHAVVGLRHPSKRAVFRLSAGIMAGFRATLNGLGFTEVQTPKLVASATESGANVFGVDYFGQRAYLAQSPQFYKQIMVGVFERVFEVGPVFRAEPHDTVRHINEYVSLDVEMGFIRDHRDVMAVLTAVVRGILAHLQNAYAAELAALNVKMPAAPDAFPAIYFPEAQELILQRWGEDCRGRARPGAAARALAGRMGAGAVRQRFPVRHRLSDGEAAVLHPPEPGRPGLLQLVRPALPRHRAGDGRAAAAPVPGLPGRGRGARLHRPGAVRDLLRGVQVRHAAPRRFCHRPGTLYHAVARPGQRPPGDAVPAGFEPADAVTWERVGVRSTVSQEYRVAPAV